MMELSAVAEVTPTATDVKTVKGTIRSLNQAVIEGNTHFYVTLEDEDGNIFDFALPAVLQGHEVRGLVAHIDEQRERGGVAQVLHLALGR